MALRLVYPLYFVLILFAQYTGSRAGRDMDLYCGACRAIVNEVEHEIGKVDPKKMIDVGSFRVDPNGKTKTMKVPLARSESQLTEFLEKVCDDISSDYIQNYEKDTGRLSLKRMITRDGKMAGDVDFQALMEKAQKSGDKPPDTDSKKVKFICESIIEEHEDDFIKLFANSDKDIMTKVCSDLADYCDGEEEFEDDKNKQGKEEL